MPRHARAAPGGMIFHVLNRGNDRAAIFHKRGDARAFVRLLGEAKDKGGGGGGGPPAGPMRLLAYCLMGNHWHLVLWPRGDGDLSAYMAWPTNTHVRRYRRHYHNAGNGHVYQGRFKSFPVQADPRGAHLLRVLRYVEANPVRAGPVARAADWPWSSAHARARLVGGGGGGGAAEVGVTAGLLDDWPVPRPADWAALLDRPQDEDEVARLRASATRGRPFGDDAWVGRTAGALGLAHTLRGRGRPAKAAGEPASALSASSSSAAAAAAAGDEGVAE